MAIYLDNAATSFPKPAPVYEAMERAQRESAIAAGRGSYQRAADSNRILAQCRGAIAEKIGANNACEISFAFSGTDALCTAILGYLNPGDHVIASAADHSSVLRPLWQLQKANGVELTILPCDANGVVNADQIVAAIQSNTKLLCLTHASNVTGAIQPVEEVGQICRQSQVAFLLDAAQTIGDVEINVAQIGCDFLAAPGHKGLMGPLGTGFLYAASHVAEACRPLRFGGTGSSGNEQDQPQSLPQKFESGNLNVPGIAGLLAGLRWLKSNEAQQRADQLLNNHRRLEQELQRLKGVELYGLAADRTTTLSFNITAVDCQTVGMLLDSEFGIECRTGLHCAPLIHEHIGAAKHDGTARLSPGKFTTSDEIDQTIAAIRAIASEVGAA